jgi:xanthine dehydrogenase YagS FAD-binding subunit
MSVFSLRKPTTVEEAVSNLSESNSMIIAGGTDLLPKVRAMASPKTPDVLVNIKHIDSLSYIKEESGMLKIGALTKLVEVAESSVVKGKYAAIAEAAHRVASPELRNMGTIGGNVCQAVRCWYYRLEHDSFPCMRKHSGGLCYALTGIHRYHSIFGAVSGCVAVNPSDVAPALMVMNAEMVTSKRTIAIDEFFTVNGEKTTALDDDEILTEIRVPSPASGVKTSFVKFALRKSFDFAIVNCAAAIGNGDAKICLNAVYNLPYRAEKAENAIKGKEINEANAEAAAEAGLQGASPLPQSKYKVQIAKTMIKRAIMDCK